MESDNCKAQYQSADIQGSRQEKDGITGIISGIERHWNTCWPDGKKFEENEEVMERVWTHTMVRKGRWKERKGPEQRLLLEDVGIEWAKIRRHRVAREHKHELERDVS